MMKRSGWGNVGVCQFPQQRDDDIPLSRAPFGVRVTVDIEPFGGAEDRAD